MTDQIIDLAHEYNDRIGEEHDARVWAEERIESLLASTAENRNELLEALGLPYDEYITEYDAEPSKVSEKYWAEYLEYVRNA